MSFLVGETIGGKFRIDKIVPARSSTRVFIAWDLALARKVVIKALDDDVASDVASAERFAAEARVAGGLKHPHIVKVFENGTHHGVPYLVTEFVPGASLASLMENQPDEELLPWSDVVTILAQVGDALDYSHEQGLVHGDVRPSNIMVDMRKEGPDATLIDFGMTANLDPSQPWSIASGFLGSAEYASPEQIQGSTDIDARSDEYSLACTAFAVLTGAPPYADARDDVARIAAHIQSPVPSASTRNPAIPPRVDEVFETALAKSRIRRYATCTEFVETLHEELFYVPAPHPDTGPSVPATASADSPTPQRRMPPLAWVTAAIAAVLVIGIGGLLLGQSGDPIVAASTTSPAPSTTTTTPTSTTTPTTTTTTTTTTTSTPPSTEPPPPPTEPPPPPPTNPYGYAVGSEVPDDGTTVGSAMSALAARSPDPSGITPDSPMAWYAVWLRHVSPAPTGAPVATEGGASFQADVPVSLDAFESGPDGWIASAQECADVCQSLDEKLPLTPPCSVNPECPRWRSTSGTTMFMLRTTVYVRFPSVTQLFETESSQPIVSVTDPTGTTTFDPDTATFGLWLEEEPQKGTVLLVNITYADNSRDQLEIIF